MQFTDRSEGAPVWIAILVSWAIALGEYCLMVPANRMGAKTVSWNYAAATGCIFAAVYFIFKGP